MWDRFDFLWQQRQEPSAKLVEQVTAVLRNRAQLERQYSNSLLSLPDEVQLGDSSSSVNEAVEAVMMNFRNRGEQCTELAEDIDNDIVLTLEEVTKQHKEASKQMFNDAQRLSNYCRDTKSAHAKIARQYHNSCIEAEFIGQEVMSNLAMKPAERSRLGVRAVQLSKQAKVTHKDYLSSIEQANRAQALFHEHMPLILNALQDMETKRSRCLRDCLMKLAVYETSWLRNLQYDIDATVKTIEASDPENDIQDFIKVSQAEEGPQKSGPFAVQPFWELGSKTRPKETPISQQQRTERVNNDREIKAHADGLTPMLAGFLAPDSPPDFAKRWEPGVVQLRTNLADLRARAAFLRVIAELIVARQAPQAEEAPSPPPLENCLPVKITAACFEVLVALFLEVCTFCEQENDAWSGKLLMVLVQLLSSEGEGGRTVSLLTRVYNHPLWNKVAFWEETLLTGIFEAHSAEALWRRQVPNHTATNVWAVSTPFINKFVWFMSQFGIRGEQARQCIREGLRKHSNILGPALDQYTRTLVSQVDQQEAQATATIQATVAAGANPQTAAFTPPPRQLEEAAVEASPGGSAGEAVDGEDDFAAVALGVQDSFGEPCADLQEADLPGEDTNAGADSDEGISKSDSPGYKEPVDTLRKLGVDQPSSSDVFG
jgi:hypothetical protein